ncbi:hypothetical protein Emag_007686 [Eimeria magna]
MEAGAPRRALHVSPVLRCPQRTGAPKRRPRRDRVLWPCHPLELRSLTSSWLSLLLWVGLLLPWGALPSEARLVVLSGSQGGPLLPGVLTSLNTEVAPWGPPLEPLVGQLLYKGSSCVPSALTVSSLDFRPKLLRLSLFKALCWIAQQLPEAAVPLLLRFASGEGPPPYAAATGATVALPAGDNPAAAAAEPAAAAAAGAAPVSKGDAWRWAFSRTLGSRKDALASLVPFSSVFWGPSTLEGPRASSSTGSWGALSFDSLVPSHAEQQERQQQPQQRREGEGVAAAGQGLEAAPVPQASGFVESLWRGGLRRRSGASWPPSSRKRIWLFDRCSEEELWGLIEAANMSGVAALILTDTTLKDYSMPLLGNALAPKPLMPVVSVPSSQQLQQIKRHALAAAAAAAPPLFVLLDPQPPAAADCRVLQPILFASVFGVLAWGAFAISWSTRCRRDGGREATPLHKLLLLPPTLKAAAAAAQAAYCMHCPQWSSAGMHYLVLVAMGLEMLAQVFFFAALLFISSGYLICRESLSRRESLTLSLLTSVVYVVSSVSQVEPVESLPLRLGLYLGLLIITSSWTSRCWRQLLARLDYVRGAGAPPELIAALDLKVQMYQTHYFSCILFFVAELASCILFFVFLDRPDLADVAQLFLELSLWTAIAATFRPRRRIPYFALLQSILPLYAATPLLPVGGGAAGELLSWAPGDEGSPSEASIPWDRPVLIVNPCSSADGASPFRSLAIGTLVSPEPHKCDASADGASRESSRGSEDRFASTSVEARGAAEAFAGPDPQRGQALAATASNNGDSSNSCSTASGIGGHQQHPQQRQLPQQQ